MIKIRHEQTQLFLGIQQGCFKGVCDIAFIARRCIPDGWHNCLIVGDFSILAYHPMRQHALRRFMETHAMDLALGEGWFVKGSGVATTDIIQKQLPLPTHPPAPHRKPRAPHAGRSWNAQLPALSWSWPVNLWCRANRSNISAWVHDFMPPSPASATRGLPGLGCCRRWAT